MVMTITIFQNADKITMRPFEQKTNTFSNLQLAIIQVRCTQNNNFAGFSRKSQRKLALVTNQQ